MENTQVIIDHEGVRYEPRSLITEKQLEESYRGHRLSPPAEWQEPLPTFDWGTFVLFILVMVVIAGSFYIAFGKFL